MSQRSLVSKSVLMRTDVENVNRFWFSIVSPNIGNCLDCDILTGVPDSTCTGAVLRYSTKRSVRKSSRGLTYAPLIMYVCCLPVHTYEEATRHITWKAGVGLSHLLVQDVAGLLHS